ncbi:hypothetical protein [Fusibacter sp. 3D3]|uniref:hypothetical protein n=1 Tax=Fusibacter sp. 3D3 TaxID=1048380 RepID=UPI00085309B3|nr:hypothetical protein [Fusibacter sp. 3D3]GAU79217.1 hypothetical protein F3D3_3875 [Fusibacter sp. 3D3]
MKKILSVMLTLTLVLFIFTGCGGGPDLTGVNQKFNEVSALFNETAALVESNGWSTDAEMLATHNSIAEALNGIKAILEDPEQSKDIDVEQMTAELDGLIPVLNDYKAAVSVPYEPVVDLTAVTDKFNEVSNLFNETAEIGNANGWANEPSILEIHNSIADTLESIRVLIEDPEQSQLIDAEQLTADLEAMIPLINDYKAAISVPYEAGAVSGFDLTVLTERYNKTLDLYNQVVAAAEANGWKDKAELTASLNEISMTLDDCYQILSDPSVLEGSDMTQADVDDYVSLIEELHSILIDTLAAVSVPAN